MRFFKKPMAIQAKSIKSDKPSQALPLHLVKRLTEGGFIIVFTLALFILLSLITYHATDPSWSHAQPITHTSLLR